MLLQLVPMLAQLLAATPAQTSLGARLADSPDLGVALDRFVAPMLATHEMSGNVLIRRAGKTLLQRSYGYANREFNVANTLDTKFLIGSITKQFTAAAILVLEEQGKLNTSELLSKYVPDFPSGDKITLMQMLTHTSGISRDLTGNVDPIIPHTPSELVDVIKRDSLVFAPGTSRAYSNNAYRILGYIVERVSGISYGQFLKRTFFDTLGMHNTGEMSEVTIVTHLADGYTPGFGPDGFGRARHLDITNGIGAGDLFSTVRDLDQWAEMFLLRGAIYSHVRDKMVADKGIGVVVGTQDGRKVIWHNGVYQGYTSLLALFPDDGTTIAYLGNTETIASEDPLQAALEAIVSGKVPTQFAVRPRAPAPAKADAAQYAGIYSFNPFLKLKVERLGDDVILEGLPLECSARDDCYYRLKGATVKFVRDGAGKVTGMNWTDLGGTYPATKAP
jgi:D-alanyl-D-alanine carboxypeptidase